MASIQHRQRADGTVAHRVMFREHKGSGVVSETFDTADQAEYFKGLVERIGGAAARAKRAQAHHEGGPTMAEVLDDYIDQAVDLTPGTGNEYRAVLRSEERRVGKERTHRRSAQAHPHNMPLRG